MPLGGLLPYNDIGGLMGTPGINPMEQGMLPPEAQQQIQNRTLMSLGLNMLANSGPSLTPTSLGQVIGQSGQQALSTGDQLRQKAIQGALLRRRVSQEDREQRRQEQLRDRFSEAFDERGALKPEAIPRIAEVDPKTAMDLYRRQSGGQPASVEEFLFFQNLPEGKRDEFMNLKRGGKIVDVAGVPHLIGPDNQATPLSDLGSEAGAAATLKQAAARGSASGQAEVETEEEISKLANRESQLTRILQDPNFESAVGPIDALTGRMGEALGTEEGVLGGEVQRLANSLVREAASTWKGAISEKELELFRESVPSRSNSPATWRSWFENEYLPMKRRAEQRLGQLQGQGESGGGNVVNWDKL